ncbi:hypothetical protein [Sphingomonas endophytica]|uniref:Uncharacterized protein n=1 Tax=Sphingomonas endophytica TaxID=869719 RepID=A0A147I610_9SPHN|nr:hypothetical protein [Sphingomonas endophytica]KTT74164.1 hypothetical protein NS334_06300 [Sphingomonas endophytica]
MSEPYGTPRSTSRSRIGPALALAILAFVVGLGLMAYAVRNTPGFFARGQQAAAPAPQPAATAAPANPDANTLALREAALAAQLANLEARAARTDADTADAAVSAGKAEAILVTFAARRALDRGAGLGYLEGELRRRFGPTLPQQVATVIRTARQPVTLEDLRESLDASAPILLATPSDWWSGIGSELRNLIVIHREGTPSPLPSDRLARARRQLDNGNVQTALAEVERLPGAADAANWTAAARRWIDARTALDTLESAAITGAYMPPPARVATPQPAPSPTAEEADGAGGGSPLL